MTYEELTQTIKELPVTQLPGILTETVLSCQYSAVFKNRKSLIDFVISILNRPLPTNIPPQKINEHQRIQQLKEILRLDYGILILEDAVHSCETIKGESYSATLIPAPIGSSTHELAKDIANKCKMFAYHSTINDHIRAILIP